MAARAGVAAGLAWAPNGSPNGIAAQAAEMERTSVRRIISGDLEEGQDKGHQKSYARQRQTLRGTACDYAGRSTCPAPADGR